MSVPSNTDDAARELLVAYLDGELSPEEARDVERRISEDAGLRREMQSLEKTWNALDELPQSTVDENFSRTTIEMVSVEAGREVAELTAAMPVARRRRRWGLTAVGAAAAVVGFVLVRGVVTAPDRELVQDLPVLWGIEPLSQNAGAEFLTLLAERQPELVERHGAGEVQQSAEVWTAMAAESPRDRRARLKGLSGAEQDRLQTAERQFHSLSEAKQRALRERYATIEVATGRTSDLHRVALAYADWAAGLTPNKQLELRQISDPEQRVQRVAELRRQERARAERQLSAEDEQALRAAVEVSADLPGVGGLLAALRKSRDDRLDALQDWAERNDSDHDGSGRDGSDRWIEKIRKGSARFDRVIETQPALRVALVPQIAFDGGRGGGGRPWPGIPQEIRSRAGEVWRNMEEQLTKALGESVQQGLADDPPERRAWKLRQWVLEVATADIKLNNMEDFFTSDALTDNERMELLALPRDEMDERIRRLYIERELGGIDPDTLKDMARRLGDRFNRERPGGPREGPPHNGPSFRDEGGPNNGGHDDEKDAPPRAPRDGR